METPKLLRPQSLTDAVVAYIRDAVIHGRFEPGQQLTEAGLTQTLGISRGTIREAMRVLANLGLVSLTSHRGAFVTMLTPERAYDIYTLRALLESYAARVSAETGRLDQAAMQMLEDRHRVLVEAAEGADLAAVVEADMAFHYALSGLCGHQLLLEHLGAIQTDSRRFLIYSDLYRPEASEIVRRHTDLLAIIRHGDAKEIESAIRVHISDVGETIVNQLTLSRGQPFDPGSAVRSQHRATASLGGRDHVNGDVAAVPGPGPAG